MPIYAFSPDLRQELRWRHRQGVRRQRRAKRRERDTRVREIPHKELDAAWLRAIDHDRDDEK